MSAPRLPRGTRRNPVRLGYAIEAERKDQLDTFAARAGVSKAVFLEYIIDHVTTEVGSDGLPTWWPPADLEEQEELPLKHTA